ncbi:hypothetical protein [Aquabacterium sp.]|uniref:hypothetical protein n=1 Tax=Aquabacterium sp. TaxID=1872578 RepID=UPI003783210E
MSSKLPMESGNGYELRFDSLFVEGRGMSFPCDAGGHVDLDNLTERARRNYLYARAVVGREFRTPAVRLRDLH